MKKVLAILAALLVLTSCVSKEKPEEKTPITKLEQFVDSMKKVYPNYEGNIAISKKIGDAFAGKLAIFPGILEDESFRIVGISEIGGKYNLMLALKHSDMECSLSVWCEDFGEEKAAALDNTKLYRLTGGTIETITPKSGIAGPYLELGDVYVKDLTVEEIPGSHYEAPMGL